MPLASRPDLPRSTAHTCSTHHRPALLDVAVASPHAEPDALAGDIVRPLNGLEG
jgi:hypothetical protein